MESQTHLVIDNGSVLYKSGFSGEDAPRSVPKVAG
jgi:actin-related protein